ncbi:MAG: helix-turn-helix transcriptional regulator [Prevotella sp.]
MKMYIKDAREGVGLSQKELAEALGIRPSTFNGYETGTHDPKSEILLKIANKCETTVGFLLGQEKTCNNKPPSGDELAEAALIRKYRAISDRGRETVNVILDLEYNRAEKEKRRGLEKGEETLSISANTKEA